jgi:hypothetical protein
MTDRPPLTDDLPARDCRDRFRLWLLGVLVVMAAWMAWVYHRGENSPVMIHDCLDSNIPTFSVFAKSEAFFAGSDAEFKPFLGGIPRNCMFSETNLCLLPYRHMSAFGAFVLSEFLVRVAAICGMALLLKRHLLPSASNTVICGAALCFGMLPFFPGVGLSIAGQPLLLYAILNLRNHDFSVRNWLIVALFPFVSSLAMIGLFLVPLLGVFVVYERLFRRKATAPLLGALLLLTCGYVAADYRLVLQTLFADNIVSHREEFAFQHQLTLVNALKASIVHFVSGQYHATSLHNPIIMAVCVLAAVAWELKMRRGKAKTPSTSDFGGENGTREALSLALACLCCGIIAIFCGLYDSTLGGRLIDAAGGGLLRTLQLQRIEWLLPVCWGLAFAFALALIARKTRAGAALAVVLIVSQSALAVRENYDVNCRQIRLGGRESQLRLTFAGFFSTPLFAEIKDYIARPQCDYRVVSLGLYPSIPLYSGFQTVDGYSQNYPLAYKHRFRKLIAGELEIDKDTAKYFDGWGSRCYLYSHELGRRFLYVKDHAVRRIGHLAIDTAALRELGADYILSAVEIGNADKLNLRLEKAFERDDSPWKICLYSIAQGAKVSLK